MKNAIQKAAYAMLVVVTVIVTGVLRPFGDMQNSNNEEE
jgi:hypothetical protein